MKTQGPVPLPVRIGKGQGDERDAAIITNEQMVELQLQMNVLDSKLLKIHYCLGIWFGNKKLKPYLKAALTSRNKDLQNFFKVSWVKLMKTSGKKDMSTSL